MPSHSQCHGVYRPTLAKLQEVERRTPLALIPDAEVLCAAREDYLGDFGLYSTWV